MSRFNTLALSAVTAFGLAVSPVPAAADTDDIAKVLAGLAVIGLIAKAVDDRNDRRRAKAAQSPFQRRSILDDRSRTRTIDGELRRIGEPRRTRTRGYKKRPLPDNCLRVVDNTRGRDRLVYTSRCLNRSYKFASKLPGHCQRLIRTYRGTRTVYGARCLARDGWRVARR